MSKALERRTRFLQMVCDRMERARKVGGRSHAAVGRRIAALERRQAELVGVLEQLPPGNYRAILTVTQITRRRGREHAELVLERAADVRVRRPRLNPPPPVALLPPAPTPRRRRGGR